MVLPDGILANMLLKNGSIFNSNEKLITAALTDLSYEIIKTQIKKRFGDLSLSVDSNKAQNTYVKLEIVCEVLNVQVEKQVHYGHHKN